MVHLWHYETPGESIIEPKRGIEVLAHLLPKHVPLVAVRPMNFKQGLVSSWLKPTTSSWLVGHFREGAFMV